MKILLFTFGCTTLLIPSFVSGQKTIMSIGAELAIPGKYKQSYNRRGTGFGGSFRIESSWGKHVSGMATIGYISYAKTTHSIGSVYTETIKVNAIPILLGIKYYTRRIEGAPKGFFISTEAGLMPTKTKLTYSLSDTKNEYKNTDLIGGVGIGYQIKKIETGFRVQFDFSETGYNIYNYNFRLAYAFLGKKPKGYGY